MTNSAVTQHQELLIKATDDRFVFNWPELTETLFSPNCAAAVKRLILINLISGAEAWIIHADINRETKGIFLRDTCAGPAARCWCTYLSQTQTDVAVYEYWSDIEESNSRSKFSLRWFRHENDPKHYYKNTLDVDLGSLPLCSELTSRLL